jgi:hypothetical protein
MPGRQRKITMRLEASGSAPEKHPDIVIIGRLYSPKTKLQSGYFLAASVGQITPVSATHEVLGLDLPAVELIDHRNS